MKKQTPSIMFLQDCLLVDNKILVVGDLHLGSETIIPGFQVKEIIEKLEGVFSLLEKEGVGIGRVILLGDVKHDFADISNDEWRDSLKLFDYLDEKISSEKKMEYIVNVKNTNNLIQVKKGHASKSTSGIPSLKGLRDTKKNIVNNKSEKLIRYAKSDVDVDEDNRNNKNKNKIIVLKGNHDTKLNPILRKRGIELRDKYIYKNICFLHGNGGNDANKVFEQLFKQCLHSDVLVMGHLHPAISLSDEYKKEKYKCFLKGQYKKKLTYILPSFNEGGIGFDLRKSEDKNLKNFEVIVYDSKNNKELNFGKLKKLVS